jgi:demethylmenaquinone methyltransferase/2-methoxy-6-polyprenyl-1,4-benzoquinol methylase
MSRLENSFGYQDVTPAERQSRIRSVFTAVAPRYDLMNDLMSFGIHRIWKRVMARAVATPGGGLAVDLAGGTGDVARLLARDTKRHVWVCDPSVAMMRAGRGKSRDKDKGNEAAIGWIGGEAEALPFADTSLDLITISFGLRNATQPEAALREAWRVLKPGGRFVCLEFSRPHFWLKPFYDLYSWQVIPRLGAAVAGQPEAYHYLIESIRRFPDQRQFAAMLAAAGFHEVSWRNMSFGIACLHCGVRR